MPIQILTMENAIFTEVNEAAISQLALFLQTKFKLNLRIPDFYHYILKRSLCFFFFHSAKLMYTK